MFFFWSLTREGFFFFEKCVCKSLFFTAFTFCVEREVVVCNVVVVVVR